MYFMNKRNGFLFTPANQFPYTLEKEVVKNMTTRKFNTEYVKTLVYTKCLNKIYKTLNIF
jgi:hypothetical protein